MTQSVVWGDEFVRLDPVERRALDQGCGEEPPVRLRSGRNMYASFQLCAGPLAKNETVRVLPGTLKAGKKSEIGPAQFDVYVEWYREIDKTWYPEVCVPQQQTGGSTPAFRDLNRVPAARYAGFWIDVFVPENARPGEYSGEVVVKMDREALTVPVQLEVVAARLSHESCLDVSMNNYADQISQGWPDLKNDPNHLHTAKYRRVERNVFRAAHEHRAFLHYLPYGHSGEVRKTFAPPLEGEGPNRRIKSWSDWDRHFGKYFDGSAFKGTRRGAHPVKRFWLPLNLCWPSDFLKFGQPGYEAEWRAVGRQMVDHFKEKGWTGTSFDMFLNHKQRFRYFPWDCEEVRFIEDNDVQRYFAGIWQGTFDHESTRPVRFDYTLGTTWVFNQDVRSDLVDFVDVFIGGGNDVARAQDVVSGLLLKGRQLWPCLNSGNIVKSVRSAIFPPLMCWMQGATGYMPYWSTMDAWGERAWRDSHDKGATNFLYCGSILDSEDTFVSVRMKAQRNAIQMVDLFQDAARKGEGGKEAVKRSINRALKISAKNWRYVKKTANKDETRSEEPPVAGWEQFTVDQYRKVRDMALTMASGDRK